MMPKTVSVLAVLFALTAPLTLWAAPTLPPRAQLLVPLKKEHPRLLASGEDFAALKSKLGSDEQLRSWHAKVQNQAKDIIAASPSKYEIPDGLRLLATSRRVMNRMVTLGLLYQLKPSEGPTAQDLVNRAWQELDAAANFPDWNPRHFLDTAEMTYAFAIAYDWFYDAWTPEQRTKLREAIINKGLQPALKVYNSPRGGWHRARHNWNQVCNGGIGVGALAIGDEEPQLCAEVLEHALRSIPLAMAEFAPDGAWKEGPGYWAYATMYNVAFLAALDSALGTDFGLSKMEGFSATGLFPLYLTGPLDRTFNYADGGDRAIRAPQMFWLARKFNQPIYAWYENRLAAPSALDLLWHQQGNLGPKSQNLPLDKYFRESEVVTLRSEWENPKGVFIAFKAGDNKANHSHLDLGCFVLDALGVRWGVDLGADDYNLPAYFGSKRWDYYRLRAEGQNTIVVAPGPGPDQDPSAAAKIVRFRSTPERAYGIADLSAAYKKNASRVERGIALLNRQRVLVQDEIEASKPTDAWWFMHTRAGVKIEDEGQSATLSELGAELRARILSPANAKFQIMEAQPLPTSPHPERQAKNEGIKKLAVHLQGVTDSRLVILLSPVSAETALPMPPIAPLKGW